MDHFWTAIVTIITGVTGVALVAALISQRAQTSDVINAATTGYSNILKAALGPLNSTALPALTVPGVTVTPN